MSENDTQPKSFGPYKVPKEREAVIKTHIAMLSETAQGISDQLPFAADVADVIRVLEANAEDNGGRDATA